MHPGRSTGGHKGSRCEGCRRRWRVSPGEQDAAAGRPALITLPGACPVKRGDTAFCCWADQGRGRAGVRPANVAGLPLKFRGGRGRGRERLVTRREAKVVLQWERFKRMYEQKGRSQWSVTTQKRVKGASGEERSQRWWRGLIHSFHKYLLGATSCQSLWLLRKMHGEYGRALFFTGNTFEGP